MNWLKEKKIAHRGLHTNNSVIPENSLRAFQEAIVKDYAIELDVRLSKDKQIIVFHDENLLRMCKRDENIIDLTFDELHATYLLESDQIIPTLNEVLKLINGKVPVLIEIKSESPKVGELESILVNILNSYKGPFAIQSFNPFSIIWFKNNSPEFLRGQLSSNFKGIEMSFIKKKMLEFMAFNFISKPDFIAYERESINKKFLQKIRRKGVPLLCWTVRSERELDEVEEYCDSIIFENFTPSI